MKNVRIVQYKKAGRIMGVEIYFKGSVRKGKDKFLRDLKKGYPLNIYRYFPYRYTNSNNWVIEPYIIIKAGEA